MITENCFLISIHPPREGWDFQLDVFDIAIFISIHPPREGWDKNQGCLSACK